MATTDVEIVRYTADVSALEASQRNLENVLNNSAKAADRVTGSLEENVKQAAQYKQRLAEISKELKDADSNSKGYVNKVQSLTSEQKTLQVALAQSTATINQQVRGMNAASGSIDHMTASANQLRQAYNQLSKAERDGKIGQQITANLKSLEKEIDTAQGKIKGLNEEVKQSEGFFSKAGPAVLGFVAAFASVSAIKSFFTEVFNTRREIAKLERALTTSLGSESLAKVTFANLTNLSKQTGLSIVELKEAFISLNSQGIRLTNTELTKLGDLAANSGKSIGDASDALVQAQQFNFERLKGLGVLARQEGDKVRFTFKGVTTEVEKSGSAVRDYILALGGMEGVAGALESQKDGVKDLGNEWNKFLNTIGESAEGLWNVAIAKTTEAVSYIRSVIMTGEQKQAEDLNRYISNRSAKIDKELSAEISLREKSGEDRLKVQAEIYKRESKQYTDFTERYKQEFERDQQALLYIQSEIAKRREENNRGQDGLAIIRLQKQEQALQKGVEASRKSFELNLYLRDEYGKRVDEIENAITAQEESRRKAREKAAQEEAKRLALAEQQRRSYNDFSIDLIENQFDREQAKLKEQFFRRIEDSKKNIGFEITTNSEEYKRLSDELIRQLGENENKRKEFERKAEEERVKGIIDGVNKQIAALSQSGNDIQANELKKIRDGYEKQLEAGVKYSVAKEQLDKDLAAKTFEIKNQTLNEEIALLNQEIVANQGNNDVLIKLNKTLNDKINEQDKLAFDERERQRQEELKKIKEAEQMKAEMQKATINVVSAAFSAAIESRRQAQLAEIETEKQNLDRETEQKKAALDRQVELGYISQQRAAQLKEEVDKAAAKKEQDLKLRQFKADQQAAISRAFLGIAQGVINAFATLPYPAALIAAAGIAAVGAIEIGVIKSQRPPKFKDGVIGFKGKGTDTSDENHVMISNNESVVTAKATKRYTPELKAMEAGTFENLMKQKYSTEDMSFLPYERNQNKKREEYKSASERDKARRERESKIDLSHMERLTKKNSRVDIRNAEEIGKAVARNIPSQIRYTP